MRIGAVNGSSAPPRRAARAGGFALSAEAREATPAGAAAPAAGLLALQDAAPTASDGERACRRAAAMLDDLRGLQLDLLGGVQDPARLARLAALTDGLDAGADLAARDAVGGVALRARLELARRRRASASQP